MLSLINIFLIKLPIRNKPKARIPLPVELIGEEVSSILLKLERNDEYHFSARR